MRAVIAAGGTAGHVNPALAIADEIVRREPGSEIRFMGREDGMENRLVTSRGYELVPIDVWGFMRSFKWEDILFNLNSLDIVDREHGVFRAVIPCSGINNVQDAIAAYALATRLGFDPARCAAALSDYEPAGMRQRFRKVRDITVIEDCYNAAPESMEAALRILSDLSCDGHRIAVLGDMLELGAV